MPNKKITIQDIANELGISRNTVSKALNNTGVLAEATKSKIIQKAIDMGYKQFAYINTPYVPTDISKNKEIALFTRSMPTGSHFGSDLLSGFEEKISNLGYKLSIYLIRDNELLSSSLPSNFTPESIDGIICIEMFDKNYSKAICELNIPSLFIDSFANHGETQLNADLLLMENYNTIYNVTKTLIKNNNTNIGFVGDIHHCQSFYERWQGYCSALLDSAITINLKNSILENDAEPYNNPEWLSNKIMQLPVLPQALICANDFIALNVIKALKHNNISIPNDILVCGFDDSKESKIIEPHLTTVNIPSYEMGDIAASLLLSRIENPSIPFRTMHVQTSVKFRESTGNIKLQKID
ncbi:MAG: LacI family transcriptional regulator [Clostridium butyricum]|nr:LacI family transcriptional regulator [Clostridium butyricum]